MQNNNKKRKPCNENYYILAIFIFKNVENVPGCILHYIWFFTKQRKYMHISKYRVANPDTDFLDKKVL